MMSREVRGLIHASAGTLALALIATFWSASVLTLMQGDPAAVAFVKQTIAWGLLILVPALAGAGGSGFALAGRTPGSLAGRKMRRMKGAAALGLVVLVPSALALASGSLTGRYYATVQGLELVAGAINMTLLALNLRDGLRMRRAREPARAGP